MTPTRKQQPLAKITWILILLAALALILTAFSFDASSRAAILESQGKGWKKSPDGEFMNAVSHYGDWPFLALGGSIALGIAASLKNRRWTEILAAALIASTVAGLLSNLSRQTTGRLRPREVPKHEAGWYGVYHNGKVLIGNPAYNSFPSSHATCAVGFAAPILFASPGVGIFAMGGAFLVCWSRMQLGAHYLSDVTVGSLLGLLVGWFVLRWVQRGQWKPIIEFLRQKIKN